MAWMMREEIPVMRRGDDPPAPRPVDVPTPVSGPGRFERACLWLHDHRRMIVVALVVVILFLAGLALHEAGILPEPINGWYEWLHMHSPIGPKMTATIAWIFGWMW
jgi:hypothetical protein